MQSTAVEKVDNVEKMPCLTCSIALLSLKSICLWIQREEISQSHIMLAERSALVLKYAAATKNIRLFSIFASFLFTFVVPKSEGLRRK